MVGQRIEDYFSNLQGIMTEAELSTWVTSAQDILCIMQELESLGLKVKLSVVGDESQLAVH